MNSLILTGRLTRDPWETTWEKRVKVFEIETRETVDPEWERPPLVVRAFRSSGGQPSALRAGSPITVSGSLVNIPGPELAVYARSITAIGQVYLPEDLLRTLSDQAIEEKKTVQELAVEMLKKQLTVVSCQLPVAKD